MLLLVNLSPTMSSWNRGTLIMLLPVWLSKPLIWTMSHQLNAFNLDWHIKKFCMKVTELIGSASGANQYPCATMQILNLCHKISIWCPGRELHSFYKKLLTSPSPFFKTPPMRATPRHFCGWAPYTSFCLLGVESQEERLVMLLRVWSSHRLQE